MIFFFGGIHDADDSVEVPETWATPDTKLGLELKRAEKKEKRNVQMLKIILKCVLYDGFVNGAQIAS